jgi:hypothetical protein
MKNLEDIETYISQLIYAIPGFSENCYMYIDSGSDLQANIAEFFSTINPDGRPSLLFATFEAPMAQRLGYDFIGGFSCAIMVLNRVDPSEHPKALIKSRSQNHELLSKVLGQLIADQTNQPTGQYRWSIQLTENKFLPESNLAGSNIYGWSMDFEITINVNNLMHPQSI